jgi:DNA-binding NtrC family response regulator
MKEESEMSTATLRAFEECLPERHRTRRDLQGARKTILVVESDVALLDVIVYILRWAGYDILAARTSPEANFICEQSSVMIDLLLSAFDLPGGNGAELAEKATVLRPNLPVVIMSDNQPAFQDLRARGYIVLKRPFSFAEMTHAIREILGASTNVVIFRALGLPSRVSFHN